MTHLARQDEYRKHIEKDPALERRFQQVYVSQPSVVDTISILRGLKDRCAAGVAAILEALRQRYGDEYAVLFDTHFWRS